jgi:hypothetical protein
MTKKAVRIECTTFTAGCPCGGAVLDANGSYQLHADSTMTKCDTCEAEITISGKTARL